MTESCELSAPVKTLSLLQRLSAKVLQVFSVIVDTSAPVSKTNSILLPSTLRCCFSASTPPYSQLLLNLTLLDLVFLSRELSLSSLGDLHERWFPCLPSASYRSCCSLSFYSCLLETHVSFCGTSAFCNSLRCEQVVHTHNT
ncbi:hypothetical protein EB796_015677 [Bugula neritina]|uniref:Uncharacterized protein n=1 Tax=Bugula neritina TaxID=10212 RepID=A0A7J7JKZ2_BUGNE|nr:hypothetical protein EB796_015677 [Bugula neritina]